jgi:photosystem II stability/assembly factor-like uncharacterized protein
MRTLTRKLKQITFLSFIFIISLAFNFQHNPSSNWYQQFLPNINGRPISDMIFTDSLTGYIVTSYISNDTSYILKTTTGGDNWNIVFRQPTNTVGGFNSIKFISLTIGFACGNFLWKTTNEGINWFNINTSGIFPEHMHILNQDTLWIIDSESLTGGVFRTTNGGVNWTQQLSLGSLNPTGIYMVNGRTGFISSNGGGAYVMKTTNSGVNWFTVVSGEGFSDMHFIDTLTGWRSYGTLKKTTDGGLNWINQTLPIGGNIIESAIGEFSVINKDTLWGVGGFKFYPGSGNRGMIYRTTNGGLNWYYQIPDTSIHINVYYFCQFTDKNHG